MYLRKICRENCVENQSNFWYKLFDCQMNNTVRKVAMNKAYVEIWCLSIHNLIF